VGFCAGVHARCSALLARSRDGRALAFGSGRRALMPRRRSSGSLLALLTLGWRLAAVRPALSSEKLCSCRATVSRGRSKLRGKIARGGITRDDEQRRSAECALNSAMHHHLSARTFAGLSLASAIGLPGGLGRSCGCSDWPQAPIVRPVRSLAAIILSAPQSPAAM
jgi:hypothetical protein